MIVKVYNIYEKGEVREKTSFYPSQSSHIPHQHSHRERFLIPEEFQPQTFNFEQDWIIYCIREKAIGRDKGREKERKKENREIVDSMHYTMSKFTPFH